MRTSRALRVALIQAGRIVEDRTFTGRAKITVGTDVKSTFLVPMGELPLTTTVFDVTRKGTTLFFDAMTEGRISLSGTDAPLQEYAPRAIPRGAQLGLPLPDDARGRVSIGEVSLLFQFVDAPKAPAPAVLPKGARGLLAQVDRSFLAILAISLGAHFAGAGWLSTQPVPEERELSVDRWAAVLMPLPKPKLKPVAEKPEVAAARIPKVAEPAPKQAANTRPSAAAIKERVSTMGMMGIIGSAGPNGESGFGDLLKDTGMTEIAAALEGAKNGLRVASIEDVTASQRKGNDTGGASEIDPIATNGVKKVKLGEKLDNEVTGRVTTEKLVVDAPDIDPEELSRWLNGRKPAIQSCYERQLKRSPQLHGRLVINFAITSRGRVGGVGFDEDTLNSSAVEQCISSMMRGWVLPFTPSDEVPVQLPFIFAPAS